MLMACSEHKQNFPKASSQQTIGLPDNATKLPKTELIHGWPKEKIQSLQRATAKAIGLNNRVSFYDNFATIDGEIISSQKMVVIPSAIFVMGCYDGGKSCFPREDIKSLITINYPFAVSENEVSNAEWALCVKAGFCESNDSITDNADFAVTSISWSEAQAYTRWLSIATGKIYRLLSESEHEHASRAAGTGDLLGNNLDCSSSKHLKTAKSDSCYFNPKDRYKTQPVGQLQPNAFGLKAIHSGRFEWLEDCWHNSIFDNTPKDGSPYKEKDSCKTGLYVARGGNMGGIKRIIRASNRHIGRKNKKFPDVGFRVVREID